MESGALLTGLTVLGLVLSGWRVARGFMRVTHGVARASGAGRKPASFDDRLAERLRELESAPGAATPAAIAENARIPEPPPAPSCQPIPGARTFGRRAR